MSRHILVVDDESGIRELLADILGDEGYRVTLAENATAARAARAAERPDLVLLDIWMPDTDGVTLLKEWQRNGLLDMPVVMMSGHATIDTAVEATRIGAAEFLEKPVSLSRLLETVQRQLAGTVVAGSDLLSALATVSPAFERARAQVEALLARGQPLLLVGPPGAAFDVFQPLLRRPQAPWLALERQSQLADSPSDLVDRASGGTLWIPDLAALSKLEGRGLLIVSNRRTQASLRLVVASTADPARLLADGRLDAAVFAPLAPGRVDVPALLHTEHDVAEVAECLFASLTDGRLRLSAEARDAIGRSGFLGDFVELRAWLERVALLGEAAVDWLQLPASGAVPAGVGGGRGGWFDAPLREARDAFERAYFEHHLQRLGGRVSALAEHVGLERTHLYRRLKQLGIRGNGGS